MKDADKQARHEAGMTPNSGKLKKDGSPVPGQSPEADARRAEERRLEREAGGTPEPTSPPVDPAQPSEQPPMEGESGDAGSQP